MPKKRKHKDSILPSEIIIGKDLTLDRWIALVTSDQVRNVFPNNCFPTDTMKNQYISRVKEVDERSFKDLLRCFLKKSGSYGVDSDILDSMINTHTLLERISEFEFDRRLLGGAAWEGNTWILDLLPLYPNEAVQVLEAYQTAHIARYTDNMLYGSYDALELVRTRYNLPREAPMSSLMQSTFLSYGGPDEDFARKIYEALQRSGVPVFFFPEHAEPGEKLHRLMRNKVNEQDRVILMLLGDPPALPGWLPAFDIYADELRSSQFAGRRGYPDGRIWQKSQRWVQQLGERCPWFPICIGACLHGHRQAALSGSAERRKPPALPVVSHYARKIPLTVRECLMKSRKS